jgi:hypothetical protein
MTQNYLASPDQPKTTAPTKSITKTEKKAIRLTVIPVTLVTAWAIIFPATAFDLSGFSGILDTVAPVLSSYTSLDINKYAGYFNTFQSVLGAVQKGNVNSILGAVGSINQSLGDSGVVIPSKLASDVLDAVTLNYSTDGSGTNGGGKTLRGAGYENASDRALTHAQNVSHRAYVESVLGEEGQKNIKKGVEGSGDLVKSSAEIAQNVAKTKISQKKLDGIAAGQTIIVAGNAQNYGKLTELQINAVQQTEIQSGILEQMTRDRTAKNLDRAGSSQRVSQSGSVFAAVAGPSQPATEAEQATLPVRAVPSPSTASTLLTPKKDVFGSNTDYVPNSLKAPTAQQPAVQPASEPNWGNFNAVPTPTQTPLW